MLIDAKGKYGKTLRLGVQTNKGNVHNYSLWLAKQWSPNDARSLTFSLTHTDYHGNSATEETGFATITVSYFTTKDEGKHLI